MSAYLAEFDDLERLLSTARRMRCGMGRVLDAYTPFAVPELAGLVAENRRSSIGIAMLITGIIAAAFAFGLQWYSAVLSYPLNVGGRPLDSWPVFLLVPFEVALLASALAGVVAFLREGGLPRLYHPIFSVPAFERASQDRFFLLIAPLLPPSGDDLRRSLVESGALSVSEVSP